MPVSLQIWDAAGNEILNSANSICRVIGYMLISGDGSITVPNGRPWFAILNDNSYDWQEMSFDFYVSGQTLTWVSFTTNSAVPSPPSMYIVYGAY